ncbi:hypothetical protein C8J57DRAFT_1517985 [Mycena rebaudengoi]|nr:hypothetical protein C8J57DRAFT_1517985 [Mycena rebaudengoi]
MLYSIRAVRKFVNAPSAFSATRSALLHPAVEPYPEFSLHSPAPALPRHVPEKWRALPRSRPPAPGAPPNAYTPTPAHSHPRAHPPAEHPHTPARPHPETADPHAPDPASSRPGLVCVYCPLLSVQPPTISNPHPPALLPTAPPQMARSLTLTRQKILSLHTISPRNAESPPQSDYPHHQHNLYRRLRLFTPQTSLYSKNWPHRAHSSPSHTFDLFL